MTVQKIASAACVRTMPASLIGRTHHQQCAEEVDRRERNECPCIGDVTQALGADRAIGIAMPGHRQAERHQQSRQHGRKRE
ncbi:hypothetical protein NKJ36_17260 [Mesorhizobium sp. M0142]|uniref:hypothetical protein n=1 Tax=Mesorhizobium sp. M0142 TaxID=2956894 RepID=UPI003336E380